MLRLNDDLNRRNVIRIAAAYLAGAWLIVQLMGSLLPMFGFAETAGPPVVVVLVIGFIPAILLAWFFRFVPGALRT